MGAGEPLEGMRELAVRVANVSSLLRKESKLLHTSFKGLVAVSLLLTFCIGARMTDTQEEFVPFAGTIFDQCTGEEVAFTGAVHVVTSTNIDANGDFHAHEVFTFEHVTGIGLTTGETYSLVG